MGNERGNNGRRKIRAKNNLWGKQSKEKGAGGNMALCWQKETEVETGNACADLCWGSDTPLP